MRPSLGLRHQNGRLQLELCPLTCRLSIKNEARQTRYIATNLSRALTIAECPVNFSVSFSVDSQAEDRPGGETQSCLFLSKPCCHTASSLSYVLYRTRLHHMGTRGSSQFVTRCLALQVPDWLPSRHGRTRASDRAIHWISGIELVNLRAENAAIYSH